MLQNHQKIVSQWLAEIGQEIGANLVLNDDGHCILLCSDQTSCTIEVPPNTDPSLLFIYIPLASLPDAIEIQLSLNRAALEMNLFGILSGGAQIALDQTSNRLMLNFSCFVDKLEKHALKQLLNDMLNCAPRMVKSLQTLLPTPSASAFELLKNAI